MGKCFLFTVGLLLISSGFATEFWQPPRKKLIECGWASPPTHYLRNHIEEYEANTPFDGTMIRVYGVDDEGKSFAADYTWTNQAWKYDFFKKSIEDLKNTKFKKFTDNFLLTSTRPGTVDWFSDAEWSMVCNNFAIMSRIARETGMKGLIFDGEWYRPSAPIWNFSHVKGHTDEEVAAKVRQRGGEFADAVFGEFPDMKLFCFFLLAWKEGLRESPQSASLMVPFINGIYDRLPPDATLIEGHEHHGYRAASPEDLYRLRVDMFAVFPQMLDRRHLNKFRTQTQLAAATYLDPYLNDVNLLPTTFLRYLTPELKRNGVLTLLRQNLSAALDISDEYAWVWSEGGRWYPSRCYHPGPKLVWEQHRPGTVAAVEAAVDPLKYAIAALQKQPGENLLKNSDFRLDFNEKAMPPNWYFWEEISGGKCLADQRGVAIQGTPYGTLTQNVAVEPNQLYYLKVFARTGEHDHGAWAAMLQYKDAAGFAGLLRSVRSVPFSDADDQGRRMAELAVLIPGGMEVMTVTLVSAHQRPEDRIVFEKAELYRVPDGWSEEANRFKEKEK